MLRIIKFFKDALLAFPVTLLFQPLARYMAFIFYYNKLIRWIHRNKKTVDFHDFYSPKRDYSKRLNLYRHVSGGHSLDAAPITYLEFGVASGSSFKWWLEHNGNASSRFFGFDTFEGLPEDFGSYVKGTLAFNMPDIKDSRSLFVKGLFQDTLPGFIQNHAEVLREPTRKLIHLDADLYSATIFALSQLYPYLNKGDIILFDEFNVAMHEFKAYDEFVNNFYVKLRLLGGVNNFYQVAFVVE
ncbi:MAG: class I SAM-dependent methyltransferase [Flavipsychrobacter sp.]|nr:class I SAM-dependent methyltransferase [Flavipsychrobacter sp.]